MRVSSNRSTGGSKTAKAAIAKSPESKAAGASKAVKAAASGTTKAGGPKTADPTQPRLPRPVSDLDRHEWYVNREFSWLDFNMRVLEEAQDEANPPLERLKFLAIVASNLDEFFEIRVAGLQRQAESHPYAADPDGLTPSQVLDGIATRVRKLVTDQYRCYSGQVVAALSAAGIDLVTITDLDERGTAWARKYFREEVFPVLTPLAVDSAHPFPQLLNKSLNLAVELCQANGRGHLETSREPGAHRSLRLGIVQVPRILPRLIVLPPEASPAGRRVYIFLSSLISAYVGQLFPGLEVTGCYAFRVTRNSELFLDEDEADNLLEAMQEQLARRRRGDAVRLEVQRGCDPSVVEILLKTFELEPVDLYEVDGPINLTRLMVIYGGENRPDLKDAPFTPAVPPSLRGADTPAQFFAAVRHGDVLLHHPYESFRSVARFIQFAAEDPQVLAIKMTLYRTSNDSPIVKALMLAAGNGKQVTALVELKARFDEENNIAWARAMEDAGVHVVCGLVGFKTHSKLGLVVRREEDAIRRYVHLGTGNYNEVTARLYTDVGLITCRPEIGEDVSRIFNLLTGMSQFPGLKRLIMAPFGLDREFIKRIEREATHARRIKRRSEKIAAGILPADTAATPGAELAPRIIAKMNALVDQGVIKALYRASQAGVEIDLIVRGICCLRPGIPGLSENIRVRSIIGRFLEHSRVYYFANGGEEEVLCGSADWMPRNFLRRVEVMYPVLEPALLKRIKEEILMSALQDNVKAREILADGTHKRVKRGFNEPKHDAQAELLRVQRPERSLPEFLPGKPGGGRLFELVPRTAPQRGLATSDGLPGTGDDPVLQSLLQSLETAPRHEFVPTEAPTQGELLSNPASDSVKSPSAFVSPQSNPNASSADSAPEPAGGELPAK